MYEPVWYSTAGTLDVLADQLHEILRLMIRPYISVRIVPAGRALNSALFLDDRTSIALYAKVLARLDEVALDEDASRRLIDRVLTRGFDPDDQLVELLGRAGAC